DVGIVPAHAGIGFLHVHVGAQVAEHRALGQHREAVGETLRYPELATVFGTEDHRLPAAEGRRAAADVHRHVIHLAFEHADQLSLRPRPLVMQAAQHALDRGGDVALHELRRQALFGETLGVPGFEEHAALVAEYRRLDHRATRQRGFDHFQGTTPRCSSLFRYWP